MEKWKSFVNHAIEVLDRPHGHEVKDFYKSIGCTSNLKFNMRKSDCDVNRYYCLSDGGSIMYRSKEYCDDNNFKIVTLEEAKRIVDGGGSIVSTVAPSINISTTKIIGRVIC
jgi:hypothetical protein